MNQLISQLESILFVAGKPLTIKKLAKALGATEAEAETALQQLSLKYNASDSGVALLQTNEEWQMASHPENRALAEKFVKAEISGELTRPQLETLTVISYCGPITKPELEQIRGVNCSLILRNLLMRGLIQETGNFEDLILTYEIAMEYLRHLGLTSATELPNYQELHKHEYITKMLNDE